MVFFNSWYVSHNYNYDQSKMLPRGIVNTFGAYQEFYNESLLKDLDNSKISWIGTFQAFLLVSFSIFSGPIFDRGYFRTLLAVGSFLIIFGLMMSSLATSYWQIFLSQGLCVGLGGGCVFAPSVAVVSTYFTTQRASAIGVVAAGGSVGSTIYPVLFRKLQPKIGYGWTTRVIGFMALAMLSVSLAVMRTQSSTPRKPRALLDLNALRNKPYTIFTLGLFLVFVGLYIPIFDSVVYARTGINLDIDLSFYLLSVLNAASAFGRIIPGILADRYGVVETITVFTLITAIFGYAWVGISSLAGFVCFAIVYGFTSGAVVSLQAGVVAKLAPDIHLIGTWMGMTLFIAGLGLLIGAPVAGALIGEGANAFLHPYIFSATFTITGGLLFLMTWVLRARKSVVIQK